MKILVVIPHSTLLSASGHRARFDGLRQLLSGEELSFLVPEQMPAEHLAGFDRVYRFRETQAGGRTFPFLLDACPLFLRRLREVSRLSGAELVVHDFPWGGALDWTGIPAVYFSSGVEADFVPITLAHLGLNYRPVRVPFRGLVTWIEGRLVRRAALTITMSRDEAQIYQTRYGADPARLYALPQPAVPLRRSTPEERSAARQALGIPEGRQVVLFHGSWAHHPNRLAVESLRREIVPQLRRAKPEVLVVAAGTDMPPMRDEGFLSLGFVAQLDTLLSCADLAVVPVYEGCGVRMKILDYFRAGLPVVSTAKGIEGLPVENGREAIVTGDTADAVTKGILGVSDPQSLAEAAQEFLRREHAPEKLRSELLARLRAAARREGTLR